MMKFLFFYFALILSSTASVFGTSEPTFPTVSRFTSTQHEFAWSFGQTAERTYIFSNCHWWESIDHQLTSVITLLTLAQNTSSIAVVPTLASSATASTDNGGLSNESLVGDYFDLPRLRQIQPVLTLREFLSSADYETLGKETSGSIALPKESQEEYESKLKLFGRLRASTIHLQMPDVDPENTNQPCHRFGGTMHLSMDGKVRYVFLDRVHFLHFCTEKFMPWWYDVRQHIRPRPEFFWVAKQFMKSITNSRGERDMKPAALTVIHVNDVMEAQKERDGEDVGKYAGEVVDGLRSNDQLGKGSVYVMYMKTGRNVRKVVSLLQNEFDGVYDCADLFNCLQNVPAQQEQGQGQGQGLWKKQHAAWAAEWALAAHVQLFIGNVHSPLSRNVCLYRKTQGKPYAIGRGFAELRKVWKWNL